LLQEKGLKINNNVIYCFNYLVFCVWFFYFNFFLFGH
jgi:hypothetical protein